MKNAILHDVYGVPQGGGLDDGKTRILIKSCEQLCEKLTALRKKPICLIVRKVSAHSFFSQQL